MKHKSKLSKTKICQKCYRRKKLSKFNRMKGGKYDLDSYCKCCRSKMHKDWSLTSDTAKREKLNREILNFAAKIEGCAITGRTDDLVWHHVNPATKKFNILRKPTQEWPEILNELQKCVPLCRPLHTKLHDALKEKKVYSLDSKFVAFMASVYSVDIRPIVKIKLGKKGLKDLRIVWSRKVKVVIKVA